MICSGERVQPTLGMHAPPPGGLEVHASTVLGSGNRSLTMAARWNDDDVGKLVEQIRTCSGLGGFADRMAAIAKLLESFLFYRELVTLMVDPETRALPDPQHVCAAKDDPARFNDYSTYYSRLDPTLPWLERNLGVPNLSSAFLPDSRFGRTEYTRDCLEAQRIRWILGAMSAMPDGWRMVYSIQRGRRDRDFTSADLRLMQRLMPEIERVAFGALLSEKLSRLAGNSEASFEGSEVAEFTQAGDLLRATPRALALLGCGSADRAGVGDTLLDAV